MRGLLRTSTPRLASYRDGHRFSDHYQLLITKKPVEYDYVAIDVTAFFGGAQRLAKNISTDDRRNKEVARHVQHAVQQLLRRVVCRHSLLLAFDGAGTEAMALTHRRSPMSRKLDTRLSRLPGTGMTRAVEDRLVRAMPLPPGFVPREVVLSGTSVEGCVEGKVAAWALDLACRDGAERHTTRSLCLVGSGGLWQSMLGLTPYYSCTQVVHGHSDLRHATLNDALGWLELSAEVQRGDARAVAVGRTDALLLTLLSSGCGASGLPPMSGAKLVVLLDAYHRWRRADWASTPTVHSSMKGAVDSLLPVLTAAAPLQPEVAAAGASEAEPVPPSSSLPSSVNTEFQLLRECAGGVVEVDLLALLVLFLPPQQVVAEVAAFAGSSTAPFARQPPAAPAQESPPQPLTVRDVTHTREACESYLSHLLGSFYLLCYGMTTEQLRQSPAYGVGADGTADVKGNEWVRFLRARIAEGRRYQSISRTKEGPTTPSPQQQSPEAAPPPSPSPSPTDAKAAYYPFWRAQQPWTAAEYAVLSHPIRLGVEQLLREFVPSAPPQVHAELSRQLTAPTMTIAAGRLLLGRLFAQASASSPHPALCFSPSYCWTQQGKSRLWSMRYVDLGTTAHAADIRHARLLRSDMDMSMQQSEDGVVAFDAAAQRWAVQAAFPLPCADAPPAAAAARPTLKVLTWNVMFDKFNKQPTPLGMPGIDFCTPQRYPVLAKLIAQEDADVVGLQEVERPFAEYLAAQPWCREHYMMSCGAASAILDPWGVLLLVKRGRAAWPVRQLTHHNVPAWSGHVSLMPVVTLDLASKAAAAAAASVSSARLVNVCSMHLVAPFVKANESARTSQDQALRTLLTRQLQGHTVVMGDFNDWPGNEFVMPAETRYVDCWPCLHPDEYGKTMDETNTFCKLKIEEMFFGRSDKVFLRTGAAATNAAALLKPVEMHLVGTRSVNAENGDEAAPAYLFPSDHYGVSTTFQVL